MGNKFTGFDDKVPRQVAFDWLADCVGYKPHASQMELHNAIRNGVKRAACNMGRQWGKTLAAAFEILVELSYKPRGMQRYRGVLNVAPLKETTKLAFDYVYKWVVEDRVFDCADAGGSDFLLYLKTPWGSKLACKTTETPRALRGEGVTLCIMDEDAFMPDEANVMGTYITPILAANDGIAIRISTPNGTDNHWYSDWHNYLELMKTNPYYYAMHATSYDNPYICHKVIDDAKIEAIMKGEDAYREWKREFLAEWTCVAGAVFVTFKRNDGKKDWHVVSKLKPERGSYIDVGLDYGHSSQHPMGLVFGAHYGDECDIFKCIRAVALSDEEIAHHIKSTFKEYKHKYNCKAGRVFGDPSGGARLAELRRKGIFVYKGQEEVNDVRKGIACLRNMFGRTDRAAIRIDSSCIDLIKEIENYQYKQDGINPIKNHDDLVDALRYFCYGGSISTSRDLIYA